MKYRLLFFMTVASFIAKGSIWRIGPSLTYKYCSEVSSLVKDGDTVFVEAAIYDNDAQVRWTANNLLIRGINGRPVLKAGSKIATDPTNGKGIFVTGGKNIIVENIEFQNCKVLSHNGAGIRMEGANLKVRFCVFKSNEMGILTGSFPQSSLLVEHCIFLNGGSTADPGYQHNIYVNHIDTFVFRYNFSYDAIAEGHELKSRASNNYILFNRISNLTTNSSRNIDLPNGGRTLILGNIIEQNQMSANSNVISFGLEGFTNAGPHNLCVVHNTVVNKKSTGSFFQIGSMDTLMLYNNLFMGAKSGGFITASVPSALDSAGNIIEDDLNNAAFKSLNNGRYDLTWGSPAVDEGITLTRSFLGMNLSPLKEYWDTTGYVDRIGIGKPDIGAREFQKPVNVGFINSDRVEVYPNPCRHGFFVQGDALAGQIKVYDSKGFPITSIDKTEYETEISCEEWPSGVYFLYIESNAGVLVRKLFVEK